MERYEQHVDVIQWAVLVAQVVAVVLLLRWRKMPGRGLLLASAILALAGMVPRAVEELLPDQPIGALRQLRHVSASFPLQSQALFLGFLASVALRRGPGPVAVLLPDAAPPEPQPRQCVKCRSLLPPHAIRCVECGRSLRPLLLNGITVLGVLLCLWLAWNSFFTTVEWTGSLDEWRWRARSDARYYGVLAGTWIALFAPPAAMIAAWLALRQGREWARVFVQWAAGLAVVPFAVTALEKGGGAYVALVGGVLLGGFLIGYLEASPVREFCGGSATASGPLADHARRPPT